MKVQHVQVEFFTKEVMSLSNLLAYWYEVKGSLGNSDTNKS